MMRSIFRLFFLIIILNGCSTLPKKMEVAEQIMGNAPDSALKLLKQLQPAGFYSDKHRALYGLLLFEALDKNYKSLEPDSLINFSIQYYQNSGDKSHLALSLFYKARMLYYAHRYDEATLLYIQALDNSDDKKDYALLGKIYSDMGDICYTQKDYIVSRKKYQHAIENFNHCGRIIDADFKLLDVGRTYYAVNDFKKAESIYKEVIAKSKDSLVCGSAFQEIGTNYCQTNQNDSAKKYLLKSLKYPHNETEFAVRCFLLADVFYNTTQYDSAVYYATVCLNHQTNFYTKRECYRLLTNVEYLRKDTKKMGIYMTRYQECTDSIRTIESQTKTTVLETMHNSSLEVSKTKKENIIVIVLAILLIVFISWYFYRQNKRSATNTSTNESKIFEQTEKIRNEGLFVRINVLLNKIDALKTEHAVERKKASVSEKEQMDRKLYNQVYDFDNNNLFFKEMDLILNNFVTKLNNCNSGITTKEMQWCCLHLLQIPNQDVLLLLNYKSESLNKLKQRLARKLDLSNVTELYDFLQKTMLGK